MRENRVLVNIPGHFACTAWHNIRLGLILEYAISDIMSIVEDYMNAKMFTQYSKASVLEISRATT